MSVSQVSGQEITLTLVGYLLDWRDSKATDFDILSRLAEARQGFDNVLEATAELCGRWVLIYQTESESRLFHDAVGLRQVCYARASGDDGLWCATQAALLADVAKLQPDERAIQFVDSTSALNQEYWWPGDRLPFMNSRALLPNHVLDTFTGATERYWPDSKPDLLVPQDAAERICQKLKGVIRAGAHRFDLVLGLSAGWDSRLLLAASRDIVDDIGIYSFRPHGQSGRFADVDVPRRLTRRLKLQHNLITEADELDADFLAGYRTHSWRTHERFAAGLQSQWESYGYSKVAMIGNVGGLIKPPYRNKYSANDEVDASDLAKLIGMEDNSFANDATAEWFGGAIQHQHIPLLDLFYWEQRMGRWLASNFVDFDFAWKEIFVPLNMRSLLLDFCKRSANRVVA